MTGDSVAILSFVVGVLEASATVFLTTLDDCLWLIPFVAQARTNQLALYRGSLFVLTLLAMALITSLVAYVLNRSLSAAVVGDGEPSSDFPFVVAGAVLCWLLAGFLYYKSWKKRMQRRRARQSLRRLPTSIVVEGGGCEGGDVGGANINGVDGNNKKRDYGTVDNSHDIFAEETPKATATTAATTTTAVPVVPPPELPPPPPPPNCNHPRRSYLTATSSLSCDSSDAEDMLSMELLGDMIPHSIRSFVGKLSSLLCFDCLEEEQKIFHATHLLSSFLKLQQVAPRRSSLFL